ncbi:MucR family transcriptional regulator [Sphingomonas sp. TX0543]|uniref:MucR family transcriptional regulator n=1 Tax=Sphingomonas sp. TX0543 TaxID=3399682 RepID=UPI003AFA14C9
MTDASETDSTLITLTADIVAAHVTNNSVAVSDLPSLIRNVHEALSGLGKTDAPAETRQEPAVSVRASIKPDYIVCLEDGKKLKMLKRHLMTHYQMTPADYRTKWNLPADYPMVAPNYAEQRRTLAKSIGLGRKPRTASAPAKATKGAPARRGRPKAGEDQPPK